jgi:hypothetical protein
MFKERNSIDSIEKIDPPKDLYREIDCHLFSHVYERNEISSLRFRFGNVAHNIEAMSYSVSKRKMNTKRKRKGYPTKKSFLILCALDQSLRISQLNMRSRHR